MNSNILRQFYNDQQTKAEVYEYLITFITDKAVKKVFDKQDTMAMAEAKEAIDEAFEELEVLFQPKPQKKVRSKR